MPKYYNTLEGPVLYNEKGQQADGFSWFESEETEQIKAALGRRDIFRIDSDGDIVYDSTEEKEPKPPAPSQNDPVEPENANKRSSRKNSEG